MSKLTPTPEPSLMAAVMAEVKRPGGKCSACSAVATLTDHQRRELDQLLAGDTPKTAIAKGLSRLTGVKVNPEALGKHHAGGCSGG